MKDEMTNQTQPRSTENGGRRDFLKGAGVAALGVAAASLMTQGEANAQRGALDPAVLNFALNLEYLEAEYYSLGLLGFGLQGSNGSVPAVGVDGLGTLGNVTVRANPQVDFSSNPVLGQILSEVTLDERAHVLFLRTALAGAQIARPAINLLDSFNTAATVAARAGFIPGVTSVGPNDVVTFDPFETPTNFLAGGFTFEDVGVTAYKGGSPLLANKAFLEAAAGILAVEAYHAGTQRTLIATTAGATVRVRVNGTVADIPAIAFSVGISRLRDTADGGADLDQGVVSSEETVPGNTNSLNIVPTDSNAIAFSRTTRQVINIVYLDASGNLAGPTVPGGFFPNGLNGVLR